MEVSFLFATIEAELDDENITIKHQALPVVA